MDNGTKRVYLHIFLMGIQFSSEIYKSLQI